MSKNKRHEEILKLIKEQEISTQEELTDVLIHKGYNVSQSTVSRDINELNLVKIDGEEKKTKFKQAKIIEEKANQQVINLFRQVTVSMATSNNLLVIKTLAGNANTAGIAVDQMHFSGILGTIAGDDTLLVVAKTNSDAEFILKSLRLL